MQYCNMIPMGSSEAKNIQRTYYHSITMILQGVFFQLKKLFANK